MTLKHAQCFPLYLKIVPSTPYSAPQCVISQKEKEERMVERWFSQSSFCQVPACQQLGAHQTLTCRAVGWGEFHQQLSALEPPVPRKATAPLSLQSALSGCFIDYCWPLICSHHSEHSSFPAALPIIPLGMPSASCRVLRTHCRSVTRFHPFCW